jgi:hypothetical protein
MVSVDTRFSWYYTFKGDNNTLIGNGMSKIFVPDPFVHLQSVTAKFLENLKKLKK